jgi:hypothetical protein
MGPACTPSLPPAPPSAPALLSAPVLPLTPPLPQQPPRQRLAGRVASVHALPTTSAAVEFVRPASVWRRSPAPVRPDSISVRVSPLCPVAEAVCAARYRMDRSSVSRVAPVLTTARSAEARRAIRICLAVQRAVSSHARRTGPQADSWETRTAAANGRPKVGHPYASSEQR